MLKVVAALIMKDGKILIAKRSTGNKDVIGKLAVGKYAVSAAIKGDTNYKAFNTKAFDDKLEVTKEAMESCPTAAIVEDKAEEELAQAA